MKTLSGELSFEVDLFDTYRFTLELEEEDVEFIKRLQSKVVELGVYEITFFHDCLEVTEEGGENQSVDFVIIHVSENHIRATGVLKHDRHTFSTGPFPLSDI